MTAIVPVRQPPWVGAALLALLLHLTAAAWLSWQATGGGGAGGHGHGDSFGLASGTTQPSATSTVLQPTADTAVSTSAEPTVASMPFETPSERTPSSEPSDERTVTTPLRPEAEQLPPEMPTRQPAASTSDRAASVQRPLPPPAQVSPDVEQQNGEDLAITPSSIEVQPRRRPLERASLSAPEEQAVATARLPNPTTSASRAGASNERSTTLSGDDRSGGGDASGESHGDGSSDGDGVGDGAGESELAAYAAAVQRALSQHKRYPRSARERGQEGTGHITLTITRDGRLARFEVIVTTGHQALDRELGAMAERAAPFPHFPADLNHNRVRLEFPVGFALE